MALRTKEQIMKRYSELNAKGRQIRNLSELNRPNDADGFDGKEFRRRGEENMDKRAKRYLSASKELASKTS